MPGHTNIKFTIRLYLATCFRHKRPSSGQLIRNWPEDGRLRPKHVAKYNLIVIIASCLDVCCVLTVHNVLYTLHMFMFIMRSACVAGRPHCRRYDSSCEQGHAPGFRL